MIPYATEKQLAAAARLKAWFPVRTILGVKEGMEDERTKAARKNMRRLNEARMRSLGRR